MPYYKIKIRPFDFGRELWIALESESIWEALKKAEQYCTYTRHIYYPLEQFLQEIAEEEYVQYMSKVRVS